jgi:hypothetical protein
LSDFDRARIAGVLDSGSPIRSRTSYAGMTKEISVVLVMPDLIRHPVENMDIFYEKSIA